MNQFEVFSPEQVLEVVVAENSLLYPFYIYALIRPDTGLPFYVGKGQRGRFLSHKKQGNRYTRAVIKKAGGYLVQIQYFCGDEADAYAMEVETIACYRGMGFRLTNLTDGGDGLRNPSVRTRQKMSNKACAPKRIAALVRRTKSDQNMERLCSPENIARLNSAPTRLVRLAEYNSSAKAKAKRRELRKSEKRRLNQLAWANSPENLARLRSPERIASLRTEENLARLLKASRSLENQARLRSPEQQAKAKVGFQQYHAARRAAQRGKDHAV